MNKHHIGPLIGCLVVLAFAFGMYLVGIALEPVLAEPNFADGPRLSAQWGDLKVAGLTGAQFIVLVGVVLMLFSLYAILQARKGAKAEVEASGGTKSFFKEFLAHFAWWG